MSRMQKVICLVCLAALADFAYANDFIWISLEKSGRVGFLAPNEYIVKAVAGVNERHAGEVILNGYRIHGPEVLRDIKASDRVQVRFSRMFDKQYILGIRRFVKEDMIVVEMNRDGSVVSVQRYTHDYSDEIKRMSESTKELEKDGGPRKDASAVGN